MCNQIVEKNKSDANNTYKALEDEYKKVSFELNEDAERNECSDEILIVSHGSFMCQIFKFLVYDLNCHFPFCHSRVQSKIPNTSVSTFSFELDLDNFALNKSGLNPDLINKLRVKCNSFHDKKHLINSDLERENACSL